MVSPVDSELVLEALRLGWSLAEVRGRNRLDAPLEAAGVGARRTGHALPLGPERTAPEQEILAEVVLGALASKLAVDVPTRAAASPPPSYSSQVQLLAKTLAAQRKTAEGSKEAEKTWNQITEVLYRWDAHIQDVLSATSDAQAERLPTRAWTL